MFFCSRMFCVSTKNLFDLICTPFKKSVHATSRLSKKNENRICQRKSLQHPIRLLGQNLSTSDQFPIFWIFASSCLQYYHPILGEPKSPDPERAHLQPFPCMGSVVNNNQFSWACCYQHQLVRDCSRLICPTLDVDVFTRSALTVL